MKKYILFKCEGNEVYDKLAYLNQDDERLYLQSWIKPLLFCNIMDILREYDYQRKDLRIHLDNIEYENELTLCKARIYTDRNYTILEEENSYNFLRLLLLRLGRITYLDYNSKIIAEKERTISLRS